MRIGHGALRPWVPADTRELIVVPLGDGTRSLGALVLGRATERYEEADEELAGVLGRFIARLVLMATIDRENHRREDVGVADPDADRKWENEPQLAGG